MENKTIIIAEAGVNHNGDINTAKKLIDVASGAGVDYVKFQTFKAIDLVTKQARKADYQIKNSDLSSLSQYEMLKNLELSYDDHQVLIDYCALKKVKFFSTAFDVDGLDYLNHLGFERFKIPSGELTNYPYLKKLASIGKPVILSTGMAFINEIAGAIKVLTSEKLTKENITILHCNTEYPTPMEDVNLKAMLHIKDEFGVKIGYSDHTLGFEVPVAAVALGAQIIEKHFTLDRSMPGPDHAASLEPLELIEMVKAIRNTESACKGSGIKEPSKSELKNKVIARKSIHLSCSVQKGDMLSENLIIPLRPGDGISPMEIPNLTGKIINKDLPAFSKLKMEDLD